MYRIFQFFIITFVLALSSPFADAVGDVRSIVVTGESPVIKGNIVEAKNNAMEEAFRTAIRKLIGAYVTAGNYTRNFESIENSIITRSQGYIKSYKVLSEWQENQIMYRKISVKISMNPVLNSLTELGILIRSMGNPRFLVLISQQSESGNIYDGSATQAVKDRFVGNGFQVLDINPNDIFKKQNDFQKLFTGTAKATNLIIKHSNAEILIVGYGVAENQSMVAGVGMHGAMVSLHSKLIRPATRKVLVSLTEKINGVGLTQDAALSQAFKKAGDLIAPRLIQALSEKWNEELLNGRPVSIDVSTTNYEVFNRFAKRLKNIFGVIFVEKRFFVNGEGRIDIKFTGSPQTLADLILLSDFHSMKVRVKEFSNDLMRLSLY